MNRNEQDWTGMNKSEQEWTSLFGVTCDYDYDKEGFKRPTPGVLRCPLLPICAPHGYCALCTVIHNGENPPKIILLYLHIRSPLAINFLDLQVLDLWLWLWQGGLQKTDASCSPLSYASYLCSPWLLCTMHEGSKWGKSAKNNFAWLANTPAFGNQFSWPLSMEDVTMTTFREEGLWKPDARCSLLPICAPQGYCELLTLMSNGEKSAQNNFICCHQNLPYQEATIYIS